ncbi:MAG TPA: pirin family protein [Cyclobacteriaceae bacterium]|nr:pirin family protein [Cyclobacteriaceae bacterium]
MNENYILHKAGDRGHADHGWLNTYHTFSFADFYDPERENFGVLRVLNDDSVAPGMGFGTHPHSNMEIISLPTYGDLEHRDSMGNVTVIRQGDIQVMSAGSGITHSEYNKNKDKQVKFFQIWIFPNKRNVQPRYGQITLDPSERHNKLQQVVSPDPDGPGVWIHQDAWLHLGKLDRGTGIKYSLKRTGNGIYAFVIEGDLTINGYKVNKRDGMGIVNTENLEIVSDSNSEILLMDVPMEL